MPFLNINGTDVEVEVGSFSRRKSEQGYSMRRGVNGDLNVDVAFHRDEFPPFSTGPLADRAAVDALVVLCDFPNTVPVWGDAIGVAAIDAFDAVVVVQEDRPMGGLETSGKPYQATILVTQA